MDDWLKKLAAAYAQDKRAVRKAAAARGVTIQTIYRLMHKHNIPLRHGSEASIGTQSRENNPNWKDGTTRRKDGYILEYRDGKQAFQHRIVMERKLGRALAKGEVVHHIDGNKSNNFPDNLELLGSHAEHMRHHCDSTTMSERGKIGNQKRWAALRARSHSVGE